MDPLISPCGLQKTLTNFKDAIDVAALSGTGTQQPELWSVNPIQQRKPGARNHARLNNAAIVVTTRHNGNSLKKRDRKASLVVTISKLRHSRNTVMSWGQPGDSC